MRHKLIIEIVLTAGICLTAGTALFAKTATAKTVDASDSDIHYVGRWDQTAPSRPWCAWQSSTIRMTIAGRSLSAIIHSDNEDYLRIVVDQDHFRSKKVKLRSGTHRYTLADELALGRHKIEIVKETYSGPGRMTVHNFEVDGEGLLPSDYKPPRLQLQFYGDSNLAGYSLEHEKNKAGAATSGCHFTFAGIASRMLNAEYQNISVSGAVIRGQQNSLMSFYDRMDFYHDEPKWDFAKSLVDICVVNIGANDVGRGDKDTIKRSYAALLPKIRRAHPRAHIVVMNAYGWDRREPANYTQEVVNEMDDANMSCLLFPWLFNEWHGCEYDHAGMAQYLSDHLGRVNSKWKPVRAMDVMSGFSWKGRVANGSFESVAPFGGFGWRYAEDGAVRVHAPAQAADGEWYLQLPPGKQVHQSRPAKPATTYRYKMKMRSQLDGAKAKVRLEFRDQKWRNEIKNAAREVEFSVDRDWRTYTVQVTSPAAGSDRSRDPWQIILRLMADRHAIEIDHVGSDLPPHPQ